MHSLSFPPFARTDSRVLILGSLPGQRSLKEQRYYAHPQNAFWRLMTTLLGAPQDLPYEARVQLLKDNRIALWDVCKAAYRPGSLDSDIDPKSVVANDFLTLFKKHKHIELIGHNGAHGAALYKRLVLPTLPEKFRQIPRVTLPSTSPAHAGRTFNEKLELWRKALQPMLALK